MALPDYKLSSEDEISYSHDNSCTTSNLGDQLEHFPPFLTAGSDLPR
jgi:hypothetical protein